MIRQPPRSTLFPSPTLFRSHHRSVPATPDSRAAAAPPPTPLRRAARRRAKIRRRTTTHGAAPCRAAAPLPRLTSRSEEHTSELQSRPHLVCRLLLEKKKTKL